MIHRCPKCNSYTASRGLCTACEDERAERRADWLAGALVVGAVLAVVILALDLHCGVGW